MTIRDKIATRTLLAVDSNGQEFCLTLGIGQPYESSPNEWACPLCMVGLHKRLVDQRGVDSWQALQLAYQLIMQLLVHFVEGGGQLYWMESREPMTLSQLLPYLKT